MIINDINNNYGLHVPVIIIHINIIIIIIMILRRFTMIGSACLWDRHTFVNEMNMNNTKNQKKPQHTCCIRRGRAAGSYEYSQSQEEPPTHLLEPTGDYDDKVLEVG
jgi:hypothetical protein